MSRLRSPVTKNLPTYLYAHQRGGKTYYSYRHPQTGKRIARLYLDCAFPGVFCNGVEVKDEEQFNNHCLDLTQPPMG